MYVQCSLVIELTMILPLRDDTSECPEMSESTQLLITEGNCCTTDQIVSDILYLDMYISVGFIKTGYIKIAFWIIICTQSNVDTCLKLWNSFIKLK